MNEQPYIIQLTSHEEKYAPPTRLLGVSRVDDIVFFDISEYDETSDTATYSKLASIGVKADALRSAFQALGE